MKIFPLTLAAGVGQTLPAGSFLQYLTGTDPVDLVFLTDSGSPIVPATGAKPGYKADFRAITPIGTRGFGKVSIVSATSQSVEIGISDAVGDYNRISGSVNATDVQANTLTNTAPVTVTTAEALLAAADSSRQEVIFYNESATITAVLIPGGGSAANGIPLPPLTAYSNTKSARAAWYGITASGSTTVRVMKGTVV
jgi:hypothetical protein